ncbi:MAG: hypothetical protein Q8O57_03695, partial [Kiritimatiellota bacterium]|nr:hypothetical protein [Kiritimatiellota bacterium]
MDCSQTTVTTSSNTLTVNWSVAFKSTFTGAKNSYMYVADRSGAGDGWKQVGTWTIVSGNQPPQVGTISPSGSSSSANQTTVFVTTCTDPNGANDIAQSFFLINSTLTSRNAFFSYYDNVNNKLYLMNDAGSAWQGGFAPGSGNTIENSYAKLDCSQTTITASSNTLTVNWSVTFKSTFTGAKNSYMYVADRSGAGDGWKQVGTWTVTAAVNQPPQVGTLIPSNGSSNFNQFITFTSTFTDPDGAQDLNYCYFQIYGGTNSTCGYYSPSAGRIYLLNDARNGWLGGYTPGTNAIIESSVARLDCSATTVQLAGTTA